MSDFNKVKLSVRISQSNYEYLTNLSRYFKGNLSKTLDRLLYIIQSRGDIYEN